MSRSIPARCEAQIIIIIIITSFNNQLIKTTVTSITCEFTLCTPLIQLLRTEQGNVRSSTVNDKGWAQAGPRLLCNHYGSSSHSKCYAQPHKYAQHLLSFWLRITVQLLRTTQGDINSWIYRSEKTDTFVENKESTGRQLQFASGNEIFQTSWSTDHNVNLSTAITHQFIASQTTMSTCAQQSLTSWLHH